MPTYEDKLGLTKPASGANPWYQDFWDDVDAIGELLAGQNVWNVCPIFTTANIPTLANATNRRHFDTIQGALASVKAASLGASGGLIEVWPGTYNEKLVIDRHSVAICAKKIISPGGYYVPASVNIRGSGLAEEVVSITPVNGGVVRVALTGLTFDNRYATTNGTEIAAAYAIACNDIGGGESDGASQNSLWISQCGIRMQTWGLNNKWTFGIRMQGFWDLQVLESDLMALKYAGGGNNGYVRNLVSMEGSTTRSKAATLRAGNVVFNTDTTGTGAPTCYTVFGANAQSNASFYRSTSNQAAAAAHGGTFGTLRGFDSGETAAQHLNVFGFDQTMIGG